LLKLESKIGTKSLIQPFVSSQLFFRTMDGKSLLTLTESDFTRLVGNDPNNHFWYLHILIHLLNSVKLKWIMQFLY